MTRFRNQMHRCFVIVGSALLLGACASPQKIIYFQDKVGSASHADTGKTNSLVYAPNDILGITVSALDADAIKPFNKIATENAAENTGEGYLINAKGMIVFPVLGELKVAGLTRTEVAALITDKLLAYVKDVVVDVQLLNFKITILGAVNKPGNYVVTGEKLTIIQAIGMAGDLSITGVRENIVVFREEAGKQKEYRVDITSKDIFASAVYNLHPNDVIYVEPNKGGINASAANNSILVRTNLSLLSSVITTIVSLIVLLSVTK
jgi:polysaccharide biosynthesis/export protein